MTRLSLLLPTILFQAASLQMQAASVVIVDAQERKAPASLELASGGAFRLTVRGKPFPVDGILAMRFPPAATPMLRSILIQRVLLVDGQVLYGEVLALDADRLTLKTAWNAKLCIPRQAVAMISQQPGWQPLFLDDFEADLTPWKLEGTAKSCEGLATSGKHSLVLDNGGSSASYRLDPPLKAGKIAVNVLMPDKPVTDRWYLEVQLASGTGSVRLEMLGPGTAFAASSPTALESPARVTRSAGWQRMAVEFTSDRLLILADDRVIGFGKPLPAPVALCRFRCEGPLAGSLIIDDFAIAKAISEARKLNSTDPAQDDLFTASGDEIFGKAVGIDRRAGVRFDTGSRARTFPWTQTAGLSLIRSPLQRKPTDGEYVRLLIRTNDGLRDELEGVITKLADDHLVLMHSWLGELSIPFARVDEIKPLYFGQCVPIDGGVHHLGKNLRKGFVRPHPTGLSLMCEFTLAKAMAGVLLIEAAHVVGPGDDPRTAESLKRGTLRTEVYLNGKLLDKLNRHVDRSSDQARTFRIAVPADRLREGRNSLEIQPTADPESGRQAAVEIYSLRLELPRSRE